MLIKTENLTGAALDWAVAVAEGDTLMARCIQYPAHAKFFPRISPSTDWAYGGPLIERERIDLTHYIDGGHQDGGAWGAALMYGRDFFEELGPTPLIAAMRAFVTSRLGNEIEVPYELLESAK